MRYLLLLCLLPFTVLADQRFETEQGQCHFAYDPNDDDNEVYFANCINTINTYSDGGERLAYGVSIVHAETNPIGIPKIVRLQGTAATQQRNYTTTNTNCAMVTSNYNGDGTNNYTTYNTNDWTLTAVGVGGKAKYHLTCRKGSAQ